MTEELLDAAEVCATLQQVGRSAVPQPVGSEVRGVGHLGDPGMNQRPYRALIESPPSSAEEQRSPGAGPGHRRAAVGDPPRNGPKSRPAQRNGALLAALAQDPDGLATVVHVVHVESYEFADPQGTGVEQLQHRRVAQFHGEARGVVGNRP